MIRRIAAIAVAAGALFAGITLWALESGEVAIVTTRAPDGSPRSTHVWFVEPDGELWLEAGAPQNPWFLDVQREPSLAFAGPRREGDYTARPDPDPRAQARVRRLLHEKYGVRDTWVGLLVDPSASVAVRLLPAP